MIMARTLRVRDNNLFFIRVFQQLAVLVFYNQTGKDRSLVTKRVEMSTERHYELKRAAIFAQQKLEGQGHRPVS